MYMVLLQYLITSIGISSRISVELSFTFYFSFWLRKVIFFSVILVSTENDIVFFGRFYLSAENKKKSFSVGLYSEDMHAYQK